MKGTMTNYVPTFEFEPNTYYTYSRDDMIKLVPQNVSKILDIGCGGGAFGSNLKSKKDVKVWGVEISRAAAAQAMKNLDRVITGDFESDNIALPPNYFDCVVFNDVLEHFKDPWNALMKARDCLIDDGFIVASIPNIRFFHIVKDLLINNEWKYVNAGILDKTHLRFFTLKSIRQMFYECNYDVVKIKGINAIEFPWKFRIFNWIIMKRFEDMKFIQFVCVAQKLRT